MYLDVMITRLSRCAKTAVEISHLICVICATRPEPRRSCHIRHMCVLFHQISRDFPSRLCLINTPASRPFATVIPQTSPGCVCSRTKRDGLKRTLIWPHQLLIIRSMVTSSLSRTNTGGYNQHGGLQPTLA